jgi:hypothetical protein
MFFDTVGLMGIRKDYDIGAIEFVEKLPILFTEGLEVQ